MTHQFSWYIEDRVVMCELRETISMPELIQMNDEIISYIEKGKAPVHAIADLRQLKDFPHSVNEVNKAVRYLKHPSMGWEIVVGEPNPLVRFVASIVCQIAGVSVHMVKTMEEADVFLAKMDMELSGTNRK